MLVQRGTLGKNMLKLLQSTGKLLETPQRAHLELDFVEIMLVASFTFACLNLSVIYAHTLCGWLFVSFVLGLHS